MDDVKVVIGNQGKEEMEMEVESFEAGPEVVGENEMELTLDSEEEMAGMEKIVSEKVQQEQKEAKDAKSKRGPKGPRNKDKDKEAAEGNENKEESSNGEKADLKSPRILEREIKKGTVTCPQGRVEKTEDNKYKMLLAPTLSVRTKDLKFEEVGTTDKLVDAKWEISLIAAEKFGDKFQHTDSDGNVIHHDWVRVELHKPGRDKDVTESYTVSWAKQQEASLAKKEERKKEEEEKKAAKEAEKSEKGNNNDEKTA